MDREHELRTMNLQLKSLESEIKERVDEAKKAAEHLKEDVISKWLKEAADVGILVQDDWIVDQKASKSLGNCCFCFGASHWSKKSEEDLVQIQARICGLLDEGKNIMNSCFASSEEIEAVPQNDFVEFESRKSNFNKVMEGLKDESVNTIGILGMGGIGKTEMVKQISNKAKSGKLFDQVVFATVSRSPNIIKIQGVLADMLDLQLEDRINEHARATMIKEGILKVNRILIILDDIWERIHLETLGIPSPLDHRGCKIVITTRRSDVCNDMCCGLQFSLNQLREDEAFALFIKYAGRLSHSIRSEAKKIVDKCGGLPLAIVTVGSSLRPRNNLEDYKDAFHRLSNSSFVGVESADVEIYPCLKLSFDYLEDELTKKCFLLCSLYPEDSRINVEELTRNAFGLQFFGDVGSVDEARKSTLASIKKLENACLLSRLADKEIEDEYPDYVLFRDLPCVGMHDLVRDVALWIAEYNGAPYLAINVEDPRKRIHECTMGIHLTMGLKELFFPRLNYPNLKILIIQAPEARFPEAYLEKASALRVLDAGTFTRSPFSLQLLNNLTSLRLIVDSTRNLSIIGKLRGLEILHLQGKEHGNYLPEEIGELCNLRLLDLSQWHLKEIPINLLSKLAKLEELYTNCYSGPTEGLVNLYEVKFLGCLTALAARFRSVRSIPPDFEFGKLQRYFIYCCATNVSVEHHEMWGRSRSLYLDDLDRFLVRAFKHLWPSVEYLKIRGPMQGFRNMSPQIDAIGFQYLTGLSLHGSTDIECLIDTTCTIPGLPSSITEALTNLSHLQLCDMSQLSMICHGPPPLNFLKNLKEVEIISCPKLKNIVPDLLPVGPVMHSIGIALCENLKSLYELKNRYDPLSLPCPNILLLCSLKKLKCIWEGPHILDKQGHIDNDNDNAIDLQSMITEARLRSMNSLAKLKIFECNEMEEIFQVPSNHKYEGQLSNLVKLKLMLVQKLKYIWRGPHQTYCLHRLERVSLWGCDGLASLFSYTLAKSLLKLQCIKINSCNGLEGIITEDDQIESSRSSQSPISSQASFLELREIHIKSCSKMKSVLPVSFIQQGLPKLKVMSIKKCDELEHLFGDGRESVAGSGKIVLDTLETLKLVHLPRLLRLSPNCHIRFPSLSQLKLDKTIAVFEHASGGLGTPEEKKMDYKPLDRHLTKRLEIVKVILDNALSLRAKTPRRSEMEVTFDLKEPVQECVQSEIPLVVSPENLVNLPSLKQIVLKGAVIASAYLHVDHPESACFSKLQEVNIFHCEQLTSLFSCAMLRGLPELRCLYIMSCSRLEKVFSNDGKEPQTSVLRHDYFRVPESTFLKLEEISIHSCDQLRSVWPLYAGKALLSLQHLRITDCQNVEYVFDDDWREREGSGEEVIDLPSLQSLDLRRLGALINVVPQGYCVNCPSLKILSVNYAEKVEKCYDSNGVFPIRAQKSLESLKRLEMMNYNVEEVFDLVEAGEQNVLTELLELKLDGFPILKHLWKGATGFIRLTHLREIEVKNCAGIKSLFTRSMAQYLKSLTSIYVYSCAELKNIVEPTNHEEDEALAVQDAYALKKSYFPQLEQLWAIKCENLEWLFPLSMVSTLPNLKSLVIRECPKLENIFDVGVGRQRMSVKSGHFQLPSLRTLYLIELPSQRDIDLQNYQFLCPALDNLNLQDFTGQGKSVSHQGHVYRESKRILPIEAPESLVDLHVIDIEFCDAEEVFYLEEQINGRTGNSFLSQLKRLRLGFLPNLKCIWKGPTHFIHLWSLLQIQLYDCMTLGNSIFTYRISRTLRSLEIIEVVNCKELLNIFEPGDEEEHAGDEGHHSAIICLPQLKQINVEGCDKLKFILPLSVTRGIPSLQKLCVKRASQLEQVFSEDWQGQIKDKEITLPELKIIRLEELPCLSSICPPGYVLSCPSPSLVQLDGLPIDNCNTEVVGNSESEFMMRNCPNCDKLENLFLVGQPHQPSQY